MPKIRKTKAKMLIVDDEQAIRSILELLLGYNYECVAASSAEEALTLLETHQFDLVLSDIGMVGMSGLELVPELLKRAPETVAIMVSGMHKIECAVEAMRVGAYDYILKPFDLANVEAVVSRAIEYHDLRVAKRLYETDLEELVTARTTELKQSLSERTLIEEELRRTSAETQQLLNSIQLLMISVDEKGIITWCNQMASRSLGVSEVEMLGQSLTGLGVRLDLKDILANRAYLKDTTLQTQAHNVVYRCPNDKDGRLEITLHPFHDKKETNGVCLLIGTDITERGMLEAQLRQAQKLESIGQLAAGIAHEINTPTQYVGDNTRFVQEGCLDLAQLIRLYEKLLESCREQAVSEDLVAELQTKTEQIDLNYLLAEIPVAIEQSLEGIERIRAIVQSMKDFAHPGAVEKRAIDLNKAIESTVTVARNEWKYIAELELNLDASLPPVPCLAGEFNQVILNMVVNASHAIKDVVKDGAGGKGKITISTKSEPGWAEIRISDTGTGIPEKHLNRIFDPFFTTKEVGKGTGQGLAISHAVIVEKHAGTISIETEMGHGTTFIIRLPLQVETPTAVLQEEVVV